MHSFQRIPLFREGRKQETTEMHGHLTRILAHTYTRAFGEWSFLRAAWLELLAIMSCGTAAESSKETGEN